MRGLALEGGGAKGSYEIGAYVALSELGYKFDAVAGTSIGSFNAALIAQKNIPLAQKLWLNGDSELVGINKDIVKISKEQKINKENINLTINEIKKLIKNKGLDIQKYKDVIDANIDETKVRKSNIKYGLVTFNINKLKELELTIDEIEENKLSDYIVASSYLPVFKPTKIIDDSYYFDGGLTNVIPINLLEQMGCDEIIAIHIDGIGKNKKYKTKNVIHLTPTKNTGPVILFDNNDLKNNYYMGYYDTYLHFNKLDGYKYYFKKSILYKFITRKEKQNIKSILKLKYKTNNIKEITIKCIEEILEYNKVYYYKKYSIIKTILFIKNNNLKCKSKIVNDYVYNLKLL